MFAERLSYLRKTKNLSQHELGEIFHISQRSISRLETGESLPNSQILNQVADFFNVSTDFLLGRTDIENIYEFLPKISYVIKRHHKKY